jgi:xylan 1,4-beta-xylosidase
MATSQVTVRRRSPWRYLAFGLVGLVLVAVLWTAGYWFWVLFIPPAPLSESKLLAPVSSVQAAAGRGQVTIAWQAVPWAVSYQVFRSEKQDRGFRLVSSAFGHIPVVVENFLAWSFPGEPFGRIPHIPFADTDVRAGHTYYYRVRANDGSGWSPQGATATVTVPMHATDATVDIRVNAAQDAGTLEHKWELAFGSEHLSYMWHGDLNKHLKAAGAGLRNANKLAHDQLGFHYVRAHGILMDDVGMYHEDANGKPRYDWSNVDRLYDMVRADGLRPIVELSFMPKALASDSKSNVIFYYHGNNSAPKDYKKWGALVGALAQHLIDRYGREEVESWPFEVWNEPDVHWENSNFWRSSPEEYFRLYDFAAVALKTVDPKLRVGGPVASFTTLQEPFLRHVTRENFATGESKTPLDFLDLHNYYLSASDYRPLLQRYGLKDVPIYYTEWGVAGQYGDSVNDMAYGAAFIASGLHASLDLVDSISYWTVSDYFEEQGPPRKLFYGGYGMIGLDGLRKSRYWAYYLLHQLGTEKVALDGTGDGFGSLITGWATRNGDGSVRVLLSNYTSNQRQAEGNALLTRHVRLSIVGLAPGRKFRLTHDRIDNDHSNVYKAWLGMGKPDWPDSSQLAVLHQHDGLETLGPDVEVTANAQGEADTEFDLLMPAVSMVVVTPEL